MPERRTYHTPDRVLVVLPTWLGDCVMATPTLRAIRGLYPNAHITGLVKANVKPIVAGTPWLDRIITIRSHRQGTKDRRRGTGMPLVCRLASGNFDLAILLPNSFRAALLVAMAKIPGRVGYDRDGRGFLLTDRLIPRRQGGRFIPTPTREYYLGIARYLGKVDPDPTMQLFTQPKDDAAADQLLHQAGYDPASGRKLVLLNPGANYGDAKMWYPDRFAAVGDRCARELDAVVAVTGAPKERAILDEVIAAAKQPMIDLAAQGMTLPLLKSIVKRASVMVTNDTGPRHMAAAFGTPIVTIFGPTDPAWTEIGFDLERIVMEDVFCGPCQLKKCPLDHRCMKLVEPDRVYARVAELLAEAEASA